MSKVEEVARALREAVKNTPEGKSIPFEEMSMILDRAAIEAMREPTEHMVKSGHRGFCFGRPLETYQEMIDAALSEEGR